MFIDKEKFKNIAREIRNKITPPLTKYLENELKDCKSVLDLGCGNNSPLQYLSIPYSVGVDIYKPALLESKEKKIHNEYILADITKIEFKEKSFDAIVMIAVLEHLSKEDGLKLIEKMEKWARKKIIIVVPNGFQHQDAYDGNPYQIHRSEWTTKELETLGFRVIGLHGWKALRGELGNIKYKPYSLWLLISDITQKITYHLPNLAATLFAIKNLE